MSGRLIVAIIQIPLPLLLAVMAGWLTWTVFTYQKGTHALVRKPVRGLVDMRGLKGTVVEPLHPDGLVKIRGELWGSSSVAGRIESGAMVIVVAQQGLKLTVRTADSDRSTPPGQQ
jgi:membrane-bound ClpP family serine protease